MDKLHLDQHISQTFNQELSDVRSQVLTMGGLAEQQFTRGLSALLEQNIELGQTVAEGDHAINQMEIDIDETCNTILARRQPAASDLRLIIAIIKTIANLERIGDEAQKLGKLAIKLADTGPLTAKPELLDMGNHVREILRDSLDAFARLDADFALKTARTDEHIDNLHHSLQKMLIEQIKKNPNDVQNIMRISWCIRAMERIGDHANNICEYVIYLVEGRDIRHLTPDAVDNQRSTDTN